MRSSLPMVLTVATLCAGLVTASPGSCTVQHNDAFVGTTSQAQLKVAAALAAEPSSSVHLLQREAAKAGQGEEGVMALDAGLKANNTGSSAETASAALTASASFTVNASLTGNMSLTGNLSFAEGRQNSSSCNVYTGVMCMLTDCEGTLSAQCDDATKFCKCPSYTCFNNGKCELSPSEIADALKGGVTGVGDSVTSIASKVPGIADSVGGLFGAASGIADTIGGIFGDWVGNNKDKCSGRYISTCFFSDCDASLGFTASCVYGSCQCKEGFCAIDGKCMVDFGALFGGSQ
mmetsp:Transcript_52535/g.122198  ORF Transcript_52535/g.122198 Transcript_52535/m.122198 type:complete len:291 (+) Transcript_52535:107-979(+)